jgi:ketosteroid isomerase-like protein
VSEHEGRASVDRASVDRWVAGYLAAWQAPGTESLSTLFTPQATYLPSPWATPVAGRSALAAFWDDERDGPDEDFTFTHEVVAVDPEARTAVVRAEVAYAGPSSGAWRDLWVIRFADDGRCAAFEEWPFSPDQPDGHG